MYSSTYLAIGFTLLVLVTLLLHMDTVSCHGDKIDVAKLVVAINDYSSQGGIISILAQNSDCYQVLTYSMRL